MSATEYLPADHSLAALAAAIDGCRGCPIYRDATQAVFGEGAVGAGLFLIGEQPGDREDRAGRPFVGPAGKLLDECLEEAGVDRESVYVTNAVKHFKWQRAGGRRLHKRPREGEIDACLPWLRAEVEAVRPRLLVCMGTSAIRAVFQRSLRLRDLRATVAETPLGVPAFTTTHPSALLRAPDPERRAADRARFVADLRLVHAKSLG